MARPRQWLSAAERRPWTLPRIKACPDALSEPVKRASPLADTPGLIVTAGSSGSDGMDVILEGEAIDVTDADRGAGLAEGYARRPSPASVRDSRWEALTSGDS